MTLTRRILKLWRSIAQTMKQLLMLFWAAQMVVTHTPHNTLYLAAALDLENNSGRLLNCPCCPNSRCGSRETLARCCCEKSFTTKKRKDFNSPKRRRMPDPVSKTTLRKIFFCGTPLLSNPNHRSDVTRNSQLKPRHQFTWRLIRIRKPNPHHNSDFSPCAQAEIAASAREFSLDFDLANIEVILSILKLS